MKTIALLRSLKYQKIQLYLLVDHYRTSNIKMYGTIILSRKINSLGCPLYIRKSKVMRAFIQPFKSTY